MIKFKAEGVSIKPVECALVCPKHVHMLLVKLICLVVPTFVVHLKFFFIQKLCLPLVFCVKLLLEHGFARVCLDFTL